MKAAALMRPIRVWAQGCSLAALFSRQLKPAEHTPEPDSQNQNRTNQQPEN